MSDATPPFSVPYLSGVKPGVLDPTQPARILRNPSSVLIFATFDPVIFATLGLDVALPPNARIVVEYTPGPGQANWFRLVPPPRFGRGICDENGPWPRVILLNGKSAILEREQWEIYKLDPAYDCFLPSPGELPTITWTGTGTASAPTAPSSDVFTKGKEGKRPGGLKRHGPGYASAFSSFTSIAQSAASGSTAGFASSTDSASSTSSTSSASTVRLGAGGPVMDEEEFSSLLNSSTFKHFVATKFPRSSAFAPEDASPVINEASVSGSTSSVPPRAPYDPRFYDVPPEFAEYAHGSSGSGPAPFSAPPGLSQSSFTPTSFSAPHAAPTGPAPGPTNPMQFVAPAQASFTPTPLPATSSSSRAPAPASASSSTPSATGPGGPRDASSSRAPAPASASSSTPSATGPGGPQDAPTSRASADAAPEAVNIPETFASSAEGSAPSTTGSRRRESKKAKQRAKPYERPPPSSKSGPLPEPFFMSAPSNPTYGPGSHHVPEASTFTFQAPPLAKQETFKIDPPTPSPTREAAPEPLFRFRSSSTETLPSPSSVSSSNTVRPRPKSPEIVDLTMSDEEEDEGEPRKDVPNNEIPVKRKRTSNAAQPRKRGRAVSPDTERADAQLKNAQRKRDQRARTEKVEDEGTKERDARLWQEILAGARQEGKYSVPAPVTQGDGMDVDHDAAIEESKRKLADLAKDQPLWNEEAAKRAASARAEEMSAKARHDAATAAAEAAAENERRRLADAAAEEQRCTAEIAMHAQQHAQRIEQERRETRQQQRLRWSPWNPTRAIPRYLELVKVFDRAKFTPERPVDPLMIPWPVLRTPFALRPRDIDWSAVEAFFAKAQATMSISEYQAFCAASNRRFHPDSWNKTGILCSNDKELNAELQAAGIIISQAVTVIWKDSRTLLMAQRPSNASPYTFAARALIRPNKVTMIPYAASAGPDVVMDAVPTIARSFYNQAPPVKAELRDLRPPPLRRASFTTSRSPRSKTHYAHAGSPASTTGSVPSSTLSPPPSPTIPIGSAEDTSSGPAKRRASRHETPSAPSRAPEVPSASIPSTTLDGTEDPLRKRRRVTRSASRSSLRNKASTSEVPSVSRTASMRTIQTDCDSDECGELKRVQKKCLQTDEERAKGLRYFTAWVSSKGDYVLSSPPPEILRRDDIKMGDLFIHTSTQSSSPQTWLCVERNSQLQWRTVTKGFVRPTDKRRLIINSDEGGNHYPSFVSEAWYNKRIKEEQTKAKGKGKARA